MPLECFQMFTGIGVPQADGIVLASTSDSISIGTKRYA